jgi:glucosamine--fructose-6-phosphate aminotransferase (isomerizing)
VADTLEGVKAVVPELFEAAAHHAPGDGAHPPSRVRQVLILACGTSYYAGCVAKYWLESVAGMPCQVEIASEYRYRLGARPRHAGRDHLAVGRDRRHPGRAAPRAGPGHAPHADGLQRGHQRHGARMQAGLLTRAGVEIGVASTKAFTTQLVGLFCSRWRWPGRTDA